MSDSIRTLQQLLVREPENTSRIIAPKDMRQLTLSAFPAIMTRDPTLDDDEINSSGAGFFAAGNSWINTVTKTYWRCFSGNPHAASWLKMGPNAVSTSFLFAKMMWLTGGVLAGTPIINTYQTVPGDTIFTWDSVDDTTWGIYTVQAGPWSRDASLPAGLVVTGPLIIWIADQFYPFEFIPTLVSLSPHWNHFTSPPLATWVVGTDSLTWNFACPVPQVQAGSGVTVVLDTSGGLIVYTVSASGGSAPMTLQPPTDPDFALALKQHSPTQAGPLLQVLDDSGTQFGPRITGTGELMNPGPTLPSTGNEIFGTGSGLLISIGQYNTLIGDQQATGLTTGDENTLVGFQAGHLLTGNGRFNTVTGKTAMYALGQKEGNSIHGAGAGYNLTTGSYNTLNGYNVASNLTTGSYNAASGWRALNDCVTGSYNVAHGLDAGRHATGSRSTFLGATSDDDGAGRNQVTAIGYGAVANADNQIMLGTASEDVHFPGTVSGAVFAGAGQGFVPDASSAPLNSFLDWTGAWSVPDISVLAGTATAGQVPDLDSIAAFYGQLSASNVGPGYAYSDLTGTPTLPSTLGSIYDPFSYGTTPTNVVTFTATNCIQGTISAENVSGSGAARLYVTTVDPRNGTQTNFIGIGGPGGWSGVIDVPNGLATLGITPGNFTSLTVAVSGNGTAGTAKVTVGLIGL